MPEEKSAVDHLIMVIGLAGLPREQWSVHDSQAHREAREFVQGQLMNRMLPRKDKRESKLEKTGTDSAGGAGESEGSPETEGRVREEGLPIEEGTQDSLSDERKK